MKKGMLVLLIVGLLAATAGADQSFYGVQAVVATQASWSSTQPARWTASGTWYTSGFPHVQQACVLALWTYGNAAPNGYTEFPGIVGDIGSLAFKCWQAAEGACMKIDGVILSSPDTFGQTVIVSAIHDC